jgi:hypothetical protein
MNMNNEWRSVMVAGCVLAIGVGLGACYDAGPGSQATTAEQVASAEQSVSCVTIKRQQATGVVEDASLIQDPADPTKANTNYGNVQQMNTGFVGTDFRRILMKFSLASIPPGQIISSSTLTLRMIQSPGKADVKIHNVFAPWTEYGVTWNNLGGAFDPLPIATFATLGVPNNSNLSVDLTGLTAGWYAGSIPNNGVLFDHPAAGRTSIGSSEAPTLGPRPSLTVCYSSAGSWPRVYGAVNANIGSYSTIGTAIATTAAGDVVVSGCNGSPGADFGGGPEAIVNSGENDIFAARYTGSNNFVSYGAGYLVPGGYGGPNPPYSYNCGTGLALDSAGVAHVIGYGNDPFSDAQGIVRIDAAGNWLGNIAFPAGSYAQGQAILLDPSDDIFYASQVATVVYSPVFAITYNLDLNKLSPAGASLWSANVASVTAAYPSLVTPSGRLAQDAAGNTFGAAYFAGSINTPSGVVVATGANDLLLYKVSPAGTVLWVTTLGGTADDIAMDVASDGSGGIWVAGHFGATFTAGAYTLTNGGGKDMFLLHLDASGNVLSATRFGTSGDDAATSLAIDSAGTLHVVGTAASSGLDLGGGPLGGTGAFLALFSSAGAHLSSQLVPSSVATFTLQYNVDPSVPRVAIAAGNASAVSYVNPTNVPEVTVLP